MSVQVSSGATSDLLTVDATSKAARVTLYDTSGNVISTTHKAALGATQGGVPLLGLNDASLRLLRVNRSGALVAGSETLLFHDDVEGTTVNTQLWTSTATTMTATQTATGITFNGSAITTINTGIMLNSQKQFLKTQTLQLHYRARLRLTAVTNQVAEWGFAVAPAAATTAQVPNGAFWRFTSGGSVQPVVAFNSSDVATGTDISSSLVNTNYYTYDVIVDDNTATFVCQNSATGAIISEQTLNMPLSQQRLWSATHVGCFTRLYNSGVAPASAGQLLLTDTVVVAYAPGAAKPWPHQLATTTSGAEVNPSTFAQTATFANSAVPAAATLSNTAAGYTTLGGLFSFAAVAGAATDYALFSFAVPSPYSFYCTGVHIAAWNAGAAVATTPTLLVWGLGTNGASANLSTGGHLRVGIGSQSFAVAAAVGANAPDIEHPLAPPLRTDAGKHLTVILRMPVATATASQTVQGAINLRGYFE